MFAFFTSLSKRSKYSKLCVFLTDQESDTQWGRDHRNLIEAFVYSEFDVTNIWSILFLVYYGIYNLICLKWQSSIFGVTLVPQRRCDALRAGHAFLRYL